ncbi:MAG TPA: hypothetical protein DCE18_18670, partial [Syntrophobacteraceae bacterium]|nr:hypothetical protein [Syntrophobacteraceae bacterium]
MRVVEEDSCELPELLVGFRSGARTGARAHTRTGAHPMARSHSRSHGTKLGQLLRGQDLANIQRELGPFLSHLDL